MPRLNVPYLVVSHDHLHAIEFSLHNMSLVRAGFPRGQRASCESVKWVSCGWGEGGSGGGGGVAGRSEVKALFCNARWFQKCFSFLEVCRFIPLCFI